MRRPRSASTTAAARSCAGSPATTREVNEEWITDKDRFAFHYADQAPTGSRTRWCATRRPVSCGAASWPEAFAVAARGLADGRTARSAC